MTKLYTIGNIEEMFKIVKKMEYNLGIVTAVYCGDPRLSCKEEKKRLLNKLIPQYRKKVPIEIQKILKIDPNELERKLK